MAHADHSSILRKLRGSLGKELVFRVWDGKTIVSKAPKRRKTASTKAQAATRERFSAATKYARSVIESADQGLAQAYAAARKPRQTVYSRATGDFMSPPVVESIDTHAYRGAPADILVIRATDDFRVTGVYVEIYSSAGALLEYGNAKQNLNGLDWIYTALQANSVVAGTVIKVIAADVPGNEGVLEVTL